MKIIIILNIFLITLLAISLINAAIAIHQAFKKDRKAHQLTKLTPILLMLTIAYLAFQMGRTTEKKDIQTKIYTTWGEGDQGTEMAGYLIDDIPMPE